LVSTLRVNYNKTSICVYKLEESKVVGDLDPRLRSDRNDFT